MKKYVLEFLKRGTYAAAGGPVILAIVYGILGAAGVIDSLSPFEVMTGVLSVTLMAFTAAGITMIYTVEQLPLSSAIMLHGAVLYLDYILIYLLNGWLKSQLIPVLIFTGIFITGYALVWLMIYASIHSKTKKINQSLQAQ